MNKKQRRRELIFAILYTIAAVILTIGVISSGEYETSSIIFIAFFGCIAMISWLKFLLNS